MAQARARVIVAYRAVLVIPKSSHIYRFISSLLMVKFDENGFRLSDGMRDQTLPLKRGSRMSAAATLPQMTMFYGSLFSALNQRLSLAFFLGTISHLQEKGRRCMTGAKNSNR